MNAGKKRSPLLYFLYFVGISALLIGSGLSEVGWKWAALPGWLWWLAPLVALLGLICNVLGYRTFTPAPPHWQRVILLGLGWGIPMGGLNLSRDALQGDVSLTDPLAVLLSAGPYLVVSLMFGAIVASTLREK